MEICVKISSIFIFSLFFLVFNHDFVIFIDFTRVAASNTATDDVTNQVTHRIIIIIIIIIRLSVVVQRFNSALMHESFVSD